MLSSVLNLIKKHFTRRNFLFVLITFSALFVLSDTSFAADLNPQPTNPSTPINLLDQGIKGVSTILSVLTSLVTLFLHPGWYNGDIFDINVYLKQIWILISNVVYFIFAILLIWIALMNIIGKGGDWELKNQLPKFIVGILIVPFSWFIVQFMLSLSSVLTVAVLTLPYDSFKNFEGPKNFMENVKVPKSCTISIGGNTSTSSSSGGGTGNKGGIDCGTETQTAYQMFSGGDSGKGPQQSVFGIMTVYTYGILDMGAASQISMKQVTSVDGIKSILNLGLKMAFSVFFIIVYTILLFALFLALFVRGVQLWIYMMISPLFGLFYYFGGSIGKLGKLSDFSLKNFIGLAMMPVYVSAALSFGLLFIGVVDYGMQKSGGNNTEMVKCNGNGANQVCSLKLGGFELVVKGALGKENAGGTPGLGGSPIGYLIMQMFAIVVLWTSVMAALKTSKLTESVIQPFEHFGSEVGSVIQKIPQYTPIFPGLPSASNISHIGSGLQQFVEREDRKRSDRFIGDHMSWMQEGQNTELNRNMAALATKIQNNSGIITDELVEQMRGGMQSYGNVSSMKNPDFQRVITNMASKLGVSVNVNSDDGIAEALFEIDKKLGGSSRERLFNGDRSINSVSSLNSFLKNNTPKPSTQQQTSNVNFTYNAGKYDFGGVQGIDIGNNQEGIKDQKALNAIYGGFKGQFTESEFKNKMSGVAPNIQDKIIEQLNGINTSGKFFK